MVYLNSCEKNINDGTKVSQLCKFEQELEGGKQALETHTTKINDLIQRLNTENETSGGAQNINPDDINKLYNELENFKITHFNKLLSTYNKLYDKVKHTNDPNNKHYQDIIDKQFRLFYNKSMELDKHQQELQKLKRKYDVMDTQFKASNNQSTHITSMLWVIFTTIIVGITIMSISSQSVHPITLSLAVIVMCIVFFHVIKNLYYKIINQS